MAGGVAAGPSTERIVGGDVADPADWPLIAAVVSPHGRFHCGGSVIAPDAVLTAAHCVRGAAPFQLRVVTGRFDLTNESAGQEIEIKQFSIHPLFERRRRHDIAVIHLRSATTSYPALLPTKKEDRAETSAGSELRVAGWGGTRRNGGEPSDVLLDVPLFAIANSECRGYFRIFHPAEEVCAFGEQQPNGNYDDSCYGDSGGPLVADAPRGALLVGVVSYGGRQCGVSKPGVYAAVADNLSFIKRKAGLAR